MLVGEYYQVTADIVSDDYEFTADDAPVDLVRGALLRVVDVYMIPDVPVGCDTAVIETDDGRLLDTSRGALYNLQATEQLAQVYLDD